MRENDKDGEANSGDQRPSPINRRAVLRGAVATGASGALAGCLGTFEREYEATPATVPEETASEHNLDPTPEVNKRSGTISQGLGVATIEADVTGYTTTYVYQGDEQQTEDLTTDSASTPTRTPEPTSTSTPPATPEPTTTPTDPQTAPEGDEDDDDDADQGSPETPPPTAVTFTDKKLQRTEDGFVAVVDSARLNQGGFIALRKGSLSGNVTGVSDYLEPGEHVNVRVRLDESISGDVTLHAVARKDDGNNIFDPATDQAYTKNGQPISDSAVVQLPEGPSVDPVKPDTLNINSTPNPNFVGQSLNPAATTSIENLIEEETEAFEQACNCTIEKPGQVEVKSVDPTDAQLSREDIGKTVFHLDKESEILSDVPQSTELLGDEKPIELFLVPSSGEKENTLRTDLVAATKTTGQLKSGTNEAVVASYISSIGIPVEREVQTFNAVAPKTTPETETDGPALVTKSQVKKTTDQLSGVCPSVTGGSGETTTPTPTPTTPTQPEDPCEQYRTLVAQRQEALSELKQIQAELKAAKMDYEANWYAKWLRTKANQILNQQNPDTKTVEAASRVLKNTQPVADLTKEGMNERARRVRELLNQIDSAVQEYARINQQIVGLEFVPPLEGPPSSVIEYPKEGPCPKPKTPEEDTSTETPTPTPTPTPTATPPETPPPPCEKSKECFQAVVCIRAYKGKTRLGTIKGNVRKSASSKMDWGHAWVQVKRTFLHQCGDQSSFKREVYGAGLYPAGAVWKAGLTGTKGDVSENTTTGFDCEYCEPVSCEAATQLVEEMKKQKQYTHGASDPKGKRPPDYHAATYNCVDWALDMFDKATGSADKVNPGPGGPLGDGGGLVADAIIDTPTELCEEIKEVQGAYIR